MNSDVDANAWRNAVSTPVVEVDDLRHRFEDGTVIRTGEIRLEVFPGECVVLIGPNGSGKSTILNHILGLSKPLGGTVRTLGQPSDLLPDDLRAHIAAVVQNPDDQLIGPTVKDDVAFLPVNLGLVRVDVARLVESSLRRFGLWEAGDRVVHALSVGERRRLALAGALVLCDGEAYGPKLVVLDEPFAALDPVGRKTLTDLILEMSARHGTAVILTTHYLQSVPDIADRVYLLGPGGRILKAGPPLEVLPSVPVWGFESASDATWFALRIELAARGADLGSDVDVTRLAAVVEEWLVASGVAPGQRSAESRAGSEMPCPARPGPVTRGLRATRTP
ncbi:MAG: ABC transporter ATP-binding protein [Chloroflexi bacterium]|nr:ABC transporter ATP-binding protein [Chloroflexota bacterium]